MLNVKRAGLLLLGAGLVLTTLAGLHGRENNGFDLRGSLIPVDEIFHGGPGKDGIPAIDEPKFISANEADWLSPQDRVLAIVLGGQAKAYPVPILNWHEIVNDHGELEDTLADQKIRILYDRRSQSARVEYPDGRPLAANTSFWFAWMAFHPESLVFVAP
jgi:hypothetical protein